MLLGGVLTDGLGWEWVLWVNVPIGIIAAALAPSLIAESRSDSETRHFDFAGAVTVTAGLSLLVYALVDATDAGWGSTQTLGLLALSAALIAAFVAIELRSASPLVPFRIFRMRTLTGANVVGAAHRRVAVLDVLLHLALHAAGARLQRDQGRALLPAAGADDHHLRRESPRSSRPASASSRCWRPGWSFIAAGLAWFSQVSVGGSFAADILGPSLLAAVGLGFAFVPRRSPPWPASSEHEAGLASGLINTSQQVGGALGLAVLATIANSRTDDLSPAAPGRAPTALTEGFQSAFLAGAGFAVLGLIAALTLIRSRDSRAHVETEQWLRPRGDR